VERVDIKFTLIKAVTTNQLGVIVRSFPTEKGRANRKTDGSAIAASETLTEAQSANPIN
jgi:hypothetical protein